jgi:hypothetical protein
MIYEGSKSMEHSSVWLQKKADVLKPGVACGKLTQTASCYGVKKYATPHHEGILWGGGGKGIASLILNLGTGWG